MPHRLERDPLGPVHVPEGAYYGAQTARALENFPISGMHAHAALVRATIVIKLAAAEANGRLGRLPTGVAGAIARAAREVLQGSLRDQFVVDIYQAGAGTSHNMNANEVLANRAEELLGGGLGEYARVHPNDHVNMGQSTNDVFPTATRLAILIHHGALVDSARELARALDAHAARWTHVLKTGRTHLQDAVPMTLGQEFSGWAANIHVAIDELEHAAARLLELNLGATAVGTGLNAGTDFTKAAVANIARETGFPVKPAANRFRVTQSMGDVAAWSAAMRRLAMETNKIASDLRLLASGPRAGFAEIMLPPVQPGSSIMPGKVNPSIPEMVNQVCYQVYGCDATVAAAADAGQLELNVMMPVMAWNALHASAILTNTLAVFRERCLDGLEADEARCRELLDRSTAVATALSPYIGYAATARIAKESVATGRPIRELVLERGLLDAKHADRILSAEAMTEPGVVDAGNDQADGAGGGARRRVRKPRARAGTRAAVSTRRSRRS
ncbi:MAG TPA: aspartate ammonia-lyase [Vicinamibacterales bacterium]|nr:aspartate ammonia-lyase [Vicinamibacterales bacterium]